MQKSRDKSTTKANADLHHGNLKQNSNHQLLNVISNKNFCRRVAVVKSNFLIKSEAGNAVCGVVYSPSAEFFRDLTSFIFS